MILFDISSGRYRIAKRPYLLISFYSINLSMNVIYSKAVILKQVSFKTRPILSTQNVNVNNRFNPLFPYKSLFHSKTGCKSTKPFSIFQIISQNLLITPSKLIYTRRQLKKRIAKLGILLLIAK